MTDSDFRRVQTFRARPLTHKPYMALRLLSSIALSSMQGKAYLSYQYFQNTSSGAAALITAYTALSFRRERTQYPLALHCFSAHGALKS